MNLGQIRERVCNALAWAPTTTAFKNDVSQVVNGHYQRVMNAERWTFRVVESSLRLFADEAVASVTVSAVSPYGVTNNAGAWPYRHLDALLYQPSDESDSLRRWGRIASSHNVSWQQLVNRALWDNSWSQSGFPDPDQTVTVANPVYLEANPGYAAAVGTFTNMYVRHDRYQMPYDCSEIISIISRDDKRGAVEMVNRTAERELVLSSNVDAAGPPRAWLLDDYVDSGPAPVSAPTLAYSGASGTLAAGTYRYMYAYHYRGGFSGVSPIATITTTASGRVDLSALEVSREERYGRPKVVFRDAGDGVFRYLTSVADATSTAQDNGSVTPLQYDNLRWDDRRAQKRMAVRFWPRPAADQWMSVQYLRTPIRLAYDADVPEFPDDYHELLVHYTIASFAGRKPQTQDMVRLHMGFGNELVALMKLKHITRYNSQRKQAWGEGGVRPGRRATLTFT